MFRAIALITSVIALQNYVWLSTIQSPAGLTSIALTRYTNGSYWQGPYTLPFVANDTFTLGTVIKNNDTTFWSVVENGSGFFKADLFEIERGQVKHTLTTLLPKTYLIGLASLEHESDPFILAWYYPNNHNNIKRIQHFHAGRQSETIFGAADSSLFVGTISKNGTVTQIINQLPQGGVGVLSNVFQCGFIQEHTPVCLYSGMNSAGENFVVAVNLKTKTFNITTMPATQFMVAVGMSFYSQNYYYLAVYGPELPTGLFQFSSSNATIIQLATLPFAGNDIVQGNLVITKNSLNQDIATVFNQTALPQQLFEYNVVTKQILTASLPQENQSISNLHLDPRFIF